MPLSSGAKTRAVSNPVPACSSILPPENTSFAGGVRHLWICVISRWNVASVFGAVDRRQERPLDAFAECVHCTGTGWYRKRYTAVLVPRRPIGWFSCQRETQENARVWRVGAGDL